MQERHFVGEPRPQPKIGEPSVIEIITDIGLRKVHGLVDSDIVSVKISQVTPALGQEIAEVISWAEAKVRVLTGCSRRTAHGEQRSQR
jgi:hypothetical protein